MYQIVIKSSTIVLFFVLSTNSVLSQTFSFTRITTITNTLDPIQPAINSSGSVAFRGSITGFGNDGIYRWDGPGNLTTIILGSNLSGNLTSAGQVGLNDSGTVVFLAGNRSSNRAVLAGNGGSLTTIASSTGPLAGYSFASPTVNNAGTAAILAYVPGSFGSAQGTVVTGNGGALTTLASHTGMQIDHPSPAINTSGAVAFSYVNINGFTSGVYRAQGGTTTTIAGTNSSLVNFFYSPNDINNAGQVVFGVNSTGLGVGARELYIGDGIQFSLVANGASNGGIFNDLVGFRNASINNNGQIAFMSALQAGGFGIFIGTNPTFQTVVQMGSALDGSTVTGLAFGNQGFNDLGQVAFYAELADGRHGIYLGSAVAVPEPSSLAILGAGSVCFGLWLNRQRRNTRK